MVAMKTVVLDDFPPLRDRLAGILRTVPGVELVGSADCSLFSTALLRTLQPQLLIVHLSDPGRRAVQILDRVNGRSPRPTVVLLTEEVTEDDRCHYHQLGVDQAFAISTQFDSFLAKITELARPLCEALIPPALRA
jgi:DNA-binding NarL/FixJ family response regulator